MTDNHHEQELGVGETRGEGRRKRRRGEGGRCGKAGGKEVTWSLVLSVYTVHAASSDGFHLAQDFHRLMIVFVSMSLLLFVSLSIFPPSEDLNLWTRVSWICQSNILCICENK